MYGIPGGYESEESELEYYINKLKVTRVAHITNNAGLNGENFDASLSDDVMAFLDLLCATWNSHKHIPPVKQSIRDQLDRDAAPLLLALKLFANCPERSDVKNKNLAHYILSSACAFYGDRKEVKDTCDNNTRMVAFNFIKSCGNLTLLKAVIETYQLQYINELLVPKIRELITKGEYKDAAQWAMNLQLTHEFGVLELVFPLILQDKIPLAEEYLNIAIDQQLLLVQFLDSLIHRDMSVLDKCEDVLKQHRYVNISHHLLSYRPMCKLLLRLAKKYNFDETTTPNLKFTKTCSYLHYHFHKYRDNGMSIDAYRELIQDAAVTKELQIDFVSYLVSNGMCEQSEIMYWLKNFKLNVNECPEHIMQKLKVLIDDGTQKKDDLNSEPAAVNSEDFLVYSLGNDSIIIVDTESKFQQMLKSLQRQEIVYFDAESKHTVCGGSTLCLLQLALVECVYLIDCLSVDFSSDLWHLLAIELFNNNAILKVGFSLDHDLLLLQKCLPIKIAVQIPNYNYLDLSLLWQLLKQYNIMLPFGRIIDAGDSLNALSTFCLGKKLDKSNQCSNWARRPLRDDQIQYAALDAHCLVLIYHTLTDVLFEHGLDIETLTERLVNRKISNCGKSEKLSTHKKSN